MMEAKEQDVTKNNVEWTASRKKWLDSWYSWTLKSEPQLIRFPVPVNVKSEFVLVLVESHKIKCLSGLKWAGFNSNQLIQPKTTPFLLSQHVTLTVKMFFCGCWKCF